MGVGLAKVGHTQAPQDSHLGDPSLSAPHLLATGIVPGILTLQGPRASLGTREANPGFRPQSLVHSRPSSCVPDSWKGLPLRLHGLQGAAQGLCTGWRRGTLPHGPPPQVWPPQQSLLPCSGQARRGVLPG